MSARRTPEQRKALAGKKAGAALTKAAEALDKYVQACRACGERPCVDDDRLLTSERAISLGDFLTQAFGSAA